MLAKITMPISIAATKSSVRTPPNRIDASAGPGE
jgi:hypothetical protein